MIRCHLIFLLILLPVTAGFPGAATWGFFMHRHINRTAVFTLPPEMIVFYKPHLPVLTATAVDPDRRRYVVPEEPPRHYIDLDRYGPEDSIMVSWEEVCLRFSRDTVISNGIVPWHINRLRRALTTAFRIGDGQSILRISSDLGHYVGDAHVPLHTTSNYDGETTGQEGIHGLWETRLPELFFHEYDAFTGKAVYLEDPFQELWNDIMEAHRMVDTVLQEELRAHALAGEDKARGFAYRGERLQPVYNQRFTRIYHRGLRGMVERQFRKSVRMTANIWYSCWVDAGQPALEDIRVTGIPREQWERKYDSLRIADSLMFFHDNHLPKDNAVRSGDLFQE